MFRLLRLRTFDFGPFKGEQSIEFPPENGVVVVFGENMRGKTLFLNAIRYALYGRILGRGLYPISLDKVANWESVAEGRYGFKVTLEFDVDGRRYSLTRECRPVRATPAGEEDYQQEVFLERDGIVLGPGQMDVELGRILPEQVSRFFLFDGELLQEYEELLRDESDMGRRITQAIERILGLPILTNARAHLRDLLNRASILEARAAQRDTKTNQLGAMLNEALRQVEFHHAEQKRLEAHLGTAEQRKAEVLQAQRKYDRVRSMLDERDLLNRQMKEGASKLAAKQKEFREAMARAWRGVLSAAAAGRQSAIQNDIAKLQDTVSKVSLLEAGLAAGVCPICLREIGDKLATDMRLTLAGDSARTDRADARAKLDSLLRASAALQTLVTSDVRPLAQSLKRSMDDMRVELESKRARTKEIDEQVANFDEEDVRRLQVEYERVVKEIDEIRHGVDGAISKQAELAAHVTDLQTKLSRLGSGNLGVDRRRRLMVSRLHSLIDRSISDYRERLRQNVERDASDLFTRLTSEPDYAALSINLSYGLTIVHSDGKPIPVRSAGAEHVVALALIGALQRNAPLRGPIIMDSPFGRLDDAHTQRVLGALPDMSSQVILLVYESELRPQMAHEILKGKLRAEYAMKRITARHTKLVRVQEVA